MNHSKPLHVLIVDDDIDTCHSLKDILELDRHRVELAFSAEDARKVLHQKSNLVVLLDRKLPDGLADHLLKSFNRFPIDRNTSLSRAMRISIAPSPPCATELPTTSSSRSTPMLFGSAFSESPNGVRWSMPFMKSASWQNECCEPPKQWSWCSIAKERSSERALLL